MFIIGECCFDLVVYGSIYQDEEVFLGYYSCYFNEYDIKVEVSSILCIGISCYIFFVGELYILFNFGFGLINENGGMVKVNFFQEVEGYCMIGIFCYNLEDVCLVYFVVQFSWLV